MRALIFFLLTIAAGLLSAQQPDTLPPVPDSLILLQPDSLAVISADTSILLVDSVTRKKKEKDRPGLFRRVFTKDYPNPKTAVFLSLALPGAGQAYNKRWWKLPIVYAVLGGLTYVTIDNVGEYRRLKDNYKWSVDDDPLTEPSEFPYNQLDATSLKQYRDQWRRYVEQSALALGLGYILTATEAFVDAHLRRFDVSEDLSLQLKPKFQAGPDTGLAFGFGATLEFGGVKTNRLKFQLPK